MLSDRAIGRTEVEECVDRLLHDRLMTSIQLGHRQVTLHIREIKESIAAGDWSKYLAEAHVALGIKETDTPATSSVKVLGCDLDFKNPQLIQAFKNVGVDVTCGSCMEIFFTGSTTSPHGCSKSSQQPLKKAKNSEKLSAPQLEVLNIMAREGKPISRIPGGFWSIEGMPEKKVGVPTWSTAIQTVRSLEKKGLLERTNRYSEDWRDDRRITQLGHEALA